MLNEEKKNSKEFPEGLISPKYFNNKEGRNWALISFGIKKAPIWVQEYNKSIRPICVFREISYIGPDGKIEGLGRSWLPKSLLSMKILAQSFRIKNPKPIGVVIQSLLNEDFEIIVVSRNKSSKVLTPYRMTSEEISSFCRIIKQSSCERVIAFTEEDIILSSLSK